MTRSLALRLDISTYWLHARGEGGGADFDLVMETDEDGLPLLRGRHVAGLLRLALERAREWRWFDGEHAGRIPDLLVGTRAPQDSDESMPGCLDIRSARVPDRLRRELAPPGAGEAERAALRQALLRRIDSTAIDEMRGVAKQAHLRSVEAAVPLPLVFEVTYAPEDLLAWIDSLGEEEREAKLAELDAAERRWAEWLEIAWPALDEIGAKRTRGFGRLRYADFKAAIEASS